MNDSDGCGAAIVFALIFAGLAFLGGMKTGERAGGSAVKEEAVKHGAAHWEVAPDGSTSFHWNDDKQEAK